MDKTTASDPTEPAVDVCHVTTTTTTTTATMSPPANTAMPATCKNTTTLERLDQAPDVRHITPVPAQPEVELTTTTMATSEIEQQGNSEPTEDREEKRQRRAEKQERRVEEQEKTREWEAEQEEEDTEEERIEESQDEV